MIPARGLLLQLWTAVAFSDKKRHDCFGFDSFWLGVRFRGIGRGFKHVLFLRFAS